MAIPKFNEDMNIISKQPNYPGSEGGLTPEEFRAEFDKAGILIQEYINNILTPELDQLVDVEALLSGILDTTLTKSGKAADAKAVGDALNNKLNISGGFMSGALSVLDPTADTHAANKGYVDTKVAGTHMAAQVTLAANGWSGNGPFTQTVNVNGIGANDRVHWGVVYSSNAQTAMAEKEAYALVDDLDSAAGSVTFTCFEEKPEVSLTIALEVNR